LVSACCENGNLVASGRVKDSVDAALRGSCHSPGTDPVGDNDEPTAF